MTTRPVQPMPTEDVQPMLSVLGAGQLGRMLAMSAAPLGVRCRFLDAKPDAPAFALGEHETAAFDDAAALDRLADGAAAVTYEFENVPVAAVDRLATARPDLPIRPSARSLLAAQDRLAEKQLFRRLGVPTPAFDVVGDRASLDAAAERLGFPFILKTRRLGYDGKGQFRFDEPSDLDRHWPEAERSLAASVRAIAETAATAGLGSVDAEAASVEGASAEAGETRHSLSPEAGGIAEAFVDFERELSVIYCRRVMGGGVAWPMPENLHEGGILRVSRAPASELPPGMAERAVEHVTRIADHLGHVGVLCLELFQQDDTLLANEFAPRVHNSGHWTIEACCTSQFTNHVLAALGHEPGPPVLRPGVAAAATINLIGVAPSVAGLATLQRRLPGGVAGFTHLYGKSVRRGRKVGHVTLCAHEPSQIDEAIAAVGRSLEAGVS